MSFDQELMRMARGVLDTVLSGFTQQLNIVGDQALNPIQAIIQQVTDGVWRGEGANKFVEEVSTLLIPELGQVMGQISTMSGNLQSASGIIDGADIEVDQLVKGASEVFNFFS
jgi:hypothetical protein